MMKEEAITGRQLITLTIMAQLGIEVLSLPHAGAETAGHDTWLAVLISGLAAQIGILLIWWLGSRYPNRNFYAYTREIVGRPIGIALNLLYGCYYAFSGLLITALYADILKRWIFLFTPRWLIFLMLFILCGYAATSTLKRLAFISQTFMIFPVICFLLIAFSGIYGLDPRNLLPVLSGGWSPVIKGVYVAFSAYIGYDLLLYAYPYVHAGKKKILLAISIANASTIVFYVTVCLVCTTMFGQKQLIIVPEPIIFILKNYRIQILQSLDILFLVFYVFVVCPTINVYFFLASKAFVHLRTAGLGKRYIWVWILIAACFIASFSLTKRIDILRIASFQDRFSILIVAAFPLLLLLISGIRSAGRHRA
ncbi:spore germination protein (amino acid permease) [Paenibacillus sp. BK033]|uniref:GerAB/ArcD/ProY family transporter n=1 Tax=Paenibacillus sp. BK033 TaxID=2512133 RepID=UPI00104A5DCF|nr:GerAB/ArcD/ProY family transporter [Paenibacillus sp. BK033]TCM96260.1 spore germination protein (amino acid permease) [Paenibacillus sp. BK033]